MNDVEKARELAEKSYQRFLKEDRETQCRIKHAVISASNRAKAEGNIEVSKIYEMTYKKMILPPITKTEESQEKKHIPNYITRYLPRI
jgi:hypothetical protein